ATLIVEIATIRSRPAVANASRARWVAPTLASCIRGRSLAGMPTRYDPARWMAASVPRIASTIAAVRVRSPWRRSTPMAARCSALSRSRTTAVTRSPRASSRRTTASPMKPAPPVTKTRISGAARVARIRSRSSVDRSVRTDRLEPRLDVAQERGAAGAVVRAVVDTEDHVHDGPDRDDVAIGCRLGDRALGDRLHRHDPDLRHVEDRHDQIGAEVTGVVDGEGAAAEVIEPELVRTRPIRDIGDGEVEPVDRERVRVTDDRDQEPVVDRYGDADVHVALGQEAVLRPVRIEGRIALERLGRRLHDERHVAERDAFLGLVRLLGAVANGHEPGRVDLHLDVRMGCLQRAGHLC